MGFVKECVIVLNIYLFGRLLAHPLSNCTTVDDDLMNCYNIYQPVTFIDANSTWQQNCQNIECFLQCISDAVGDCYLTDKYFTYEMAVLTVYYRASCSNLEVNVASLIECQPYNTTCLVETDALNVGLAATIKYSDGNYAAYKEAYCNYTKLQRGCISFDTLENCTATVASFYESILIVSTSYSQCGNDQNHEYFTIYNGSIGCVNPYTLGNTVGMTSMSSSLSETITSSPAVSSTSSSFSTSSPTTRSSSPSSSTPSSTMPSSSLTSFFTSLLSTSSPPATSILSSIYPSSTTTTTKTTTTTTTSSSSPLSNCTTVDDDLMNCYNIYQSVTFIDANSTWQQNCQNIECFLQCMSDAVGDCYLTDKYFTYEMAVLTVYYRASCSNLEVNVASLIECQPYNTTCLVETDAINVALVAKTTIMRATTLRTKRRIASNYTKLQRGCISLDTLETCTATVASFYESILIVSTSYSQCGNDQNHEYFTIYNGSIGCVNPYTLGTTVGMTSMSSSLSETITSSPAVSSTSSSFSTSSPTTRSSSPSSSTPSSTMPSSSLTSFFTSLLSTSSPPATSILSSIYPSSTTTTKTTTTTTTTSSSSPLSNCTTVDDDLMNCYNIYQSVTFIDANSTWQQNCQNIECFLQCMSDAVGDCYLTDKYFTYEMAVLTVYYRASCSNLEVNVASLIECQPYNTTCLVETDAINVALVAKNNYNEGNYVAYKEAYCNYTKLQRGCISLDTLETCTATVASFYESILIVSTSYSQCGNDQNHEYFTIYNGSIGCVNPYTLGTTVGMTSMSSSLSETITSSPAAPSTSSSFSTSSPTTRSSSSSSSTSSSTMSSSSLTSFFTSLLSTSSPPSTSTLSSKYPSSTTTTSSSSSPSSSSSSIKSSTSSFSSSALSTDMESSSSSSFMTSSSSSSLSSKSVSSASLTSLTSSLSTSSPPLTSTLSSISPSSTTSTSSIKFQSSSFTSSVLSTDMESSSSSSFMSSTSSPLHSTLDTSISPKAEHGSSSTSSTNTAGCSYPVIQSSLGKCLTVTMDTFNTSTADEALRDYCDNVECNIQCYIDSVGECYKDDAFFTFDTQTAKVSNRVYCNNYTETLFAFITCQFDDFSCLSSFASTLTTDILPLYNDGKFTEYRKEYCSLLTTLKSCLTASAVVGCDVEQATLFKDIYLASLSYSKCEEQNHAYFTTYGHDVTCNSASILSDIFVIITVAVITLAKITV